MKGDIIYITLRPEDFGYHNVTKEDNFREFYSNRCPITKALTRNGYSDIIVDYHWLECNVGEFEIKRSFTFDDFLYVKEAYRLDPKMKKCEYYVTLIEQ